MSKRFNMVRVDKKALTNNISEVRRLVGPRVKIMAVVKANGYGHGVVPTGLCFVESGADALGVMDLHEATCLRDAGVNIPIYILAGIQTSQCDEILNRDLIPFIYEIETARAMNEAAGKRNVKKSVHLKMDTGMNRLGAPYGQGADFLHQIKELSNLDVQGLATHFSDADLKDSDFINLQISRFKELSTLALSLGFNLKLNNAANSAAVLSLTPAHFDMVRPGLMLYGDYPASHLMEKADLRQAMSVTSRVIQVKNIPADESVSYGRTWTTDKETVLATAPLGYIHGFNRLLSNQGQVLIRGQRAPIRGRVCMNLTMFDVTHIPGVAVGDEIMVMGSQGKETISAGEIAERIGTISYEVFCVMGSLNEKEFV